MKRIMTTGAVSVALAAATLLAPSALAAPGNRDDGRADARTTVKVERTVTQTRTADNRNSFRGDQRQDLRGDRRDDRTRNYRDSDRRYDDNSRRGKYDRYDRWDWNDRFDRRDELTHREVRRAIRMCAAALDAKTDQYYPGRFGDADYIRRPRVDVAGRAGRAIEVRGPVQVTNRRGSKVVPSSCLVRHNRVVGLDFDPQDRWDHRRNRYSQNGINLGVRIGF